MSPLLSMNCTSYNTLSAVVASTRIIGSVEAPVLSHTQINPFEVQATRYVFPDCVGLNADPNNVHDVDKRDFLQEVLLLLPYEYSLVVLRKNFLLDAAKSVEKGDNLIIASIIVGGKGWRVVANKVQAADENEAS